MEEKSYSNTQAVNWLLDYLMKSLVHTSLENRDVGIRHADHVAPYIRKMLAITSPTSGGRSVGIVCSRT
jgi:hypothetical protein